MKMDRQRLLTAIAVVASVLALIVIAPLARADATYLVSGTVTDWGTGLPVSGARVIADRDNGIQATSDDAGHYALRLPATSNTYSLLVEPPAIYYKPKVPTEIVVSNADVPNVDIALKRDRAKVIAPHLEAVTVVAAPGKSVTVDLAPYLTPGSYPTFSVEFGIPNYRATAPGARILLDHQAETRAGNVTIDGAKLTFTASKSKPGAKDTLNLLALDPSNFGSGADLNLAVKPTKSCTAAKAALAKAQKAKAGPATIASAKGKVTSACKA